MTIAVLWVFLFAASVLPEGNGAPLGNDAWAQTLLQRPGSNSEAVAQAQLLQDALLLDRAHALRELFAGWRRLQQGQGNQADVSSDAFEQSVDEVVAHNLVAHEGSWLALNHLSSSPRFRLRMLRAASAAPASLTPAPPSLPPATRPPSLPAPRRSLPLLSSSVRGAALSAQQRALLVQALPATSTPLSPSPARASPQPVPREPPSPAVTAAAPPTAAPLRPLRPVRTIASMPHIPSPKPRFPSPKPSSPRPSPSPSPSSPSLSPKPAAPSPLPPRTPPPFSAPRASDLHTTRLKGGTASSAGLVFPPPQYVNWTQMGKTTPVKDQGSLCASCWANAAVSAAESALAITYSVTPAALSRQILIDCANSETLGVDYAFNDGCSGGDATNALFFMMSWTYPTEKAYPYTASFGSWSARNCNTSMMALPAGDQTWLQLAGFSMYPKSDEVTLQAAVAVQPLVIYWCLGYTWSSYAGGVYTLANQQDPNYGCSDDPYNTDHAMLLVGFNTKVSPKIWVLQNSFGTGWGEKGFARVQMTGDENGPCGMYGFNVAPKLAFTRPPPNLVHPPPFPKSAAPSPPTACLTSDDPPKCAVIRQDDLCDFMEGISARCPCWCTDHPPPPQIMPPPPPLNSVCAKEAAAKCYTLGNTNIATYQTCLKDPKLREKCPCTCKAVGYCAKEDQGQVPCYDRVIASGNLSAFCQLGIYAKDALFCPCWCLNLRPKPPALVNWRARGKLTTTKDINNTAGCFSDWAMSSIAAVEAALAIVYPRSKPTAFSPQIIIDCANYQIAGEDFLRGTGCDGGYPEVALQFISNFTIPTASAYPYASGTTGKTGTCRTGMMALQNSDNNWLRSTGFWVVEAIEESVLIAAVAVQPIVAFFFIGANFEKYSGGVYTVAQQADTAAGCISDPAEYQPDIDYYYVLIAGYSNQSTVPLWILQFPFGPLWGEAGLARVEMSHKPRGPCGLYNFIYVPDLSFDHVPSTISATPVSPNPPSFPPTLSPPPGISPSPPMVPGPFYSMSGPLSWHTMKVNSVAFTPDSAVVMSASDDITVRQWDVVAAERRSLPLVGHNDSVNSVAVSADGDYLASGSADSTVLLYSGATGARVCPPLANHTAPVVGVAFSYGGGTLASASYDKTIVLWTPFSCRRTGALVGHTDKVTSVAFHPDGKRLVSGSLDKTLRLWNLTTTKQDEPPLTGHTDYVNSVAFSHDGTLIASASSDFTIRLWITANKQPLMGPLIGHTSIVTSVAFSPDGQYLVSGSGDRTVRLWSPKTGKQIGVPLLGHTDIVTSVAFSPDGLWIASASVDATVRIWGIPPSDCVDLIAGNTCAGWHADGYCNALATANDKSVPEYWCRRTCNTCGHCRDWTSNCSTWNTGGEGVCDSTDKSDGLPIATYWCPHECGKC